MRETCVRDVREAVFHCWNVSCLQVHAQGPSIGSHRMGPPQPWFYKVLMSLIATLLHIFHHLSRISPFTLLFGRFTEVNQYNWFGYNVVAPRIPNGSGFYLPLPTGSRRYGLHSVGVNTGLYPWEIQNSRNTESSSAPVTSSDCKHRKPS